MPKATMLTFKGKTQSIPQWAKEIGVKTSSLHSRLQRGMSIEEALSIERKENFKDIQDEKFGKLKVLYRVGSSSNQKSLWRCLCDCGNTTDVISGNLVNGNQTSCGCSKVGVTKHGYASEKARSRTYTIWAGMHSRCNNHVRNYGAKGIKVCDRWESFENFLIDMGKAPDDMSIDRIDSKGNYEPSNCKWSTSIEQNRNTSKNRYLTFSSQTKCIAEWSQLLGIEESLIRWRLKQGWSIEKVLTTPAKDKPQPITYNGKTQSLWAWSKELQINHSTLLERIKQGWSVERALTEPVHTNK